MRVVAFVAKIILLSSKWRISLENDHLRFSVSKKPRPGHVDIVAIHHFHCKLHDERKMALFQCEKVPGTSYKQSLLSQLSFNVSFLHVKNMGIMILQSIIIHHGINRS